MDNKQRIAICYDTWRNVKGEQASQDYPIPDKCVCRECGYVLENPTKHCNEYTCPECGAQLYRRERPTEMKEKMHIDFKKILQDFLSLFGDLGKQKFEDFLKDYRLNPELSYGSQITRECLNGVCEAFQWTKPFIRFYREDDGGRYYKLRALTATVSMNKNVYDELEKIERSARTLTYRPLNINHDHSKWLRFPENRVDWAEFEDKAVECVIRIDNSRRDIQRMIESGEIVNPSIEARPIGGIQAEDGSYVPEAWNFTGMALLEKDVTLPGVPTTYGIELLSFNEGMAKGLVESLSVENDGEEGELEKEPMKSAKDVISLPDRDSSQEQNDEMQEHFGIDGLSTCGQCKFFEILESTTTKNPSASGDGVDTDAFYTVSSGNFGLGVGVCKVASEIQGRQILVKNTDWSCSDGRVRDTPVTVNRTKKTSFQEEIDEMKEKAEVIELKRNIADLQEKLASSELEVNKQRDEKAKLRYEIVDLQEKITSSEKDKSSDTGKITRLTKDLSELRETVDRLKDEASDNSIELQRAKKDIEYYKEQTNKYQKETHNLKEEISDKKAELSLAYEKLNDETEKRASAVQTMRNSLEDVSRLQNENALLHEKILEHTRTISDQAERNSTQAKDSIKTYEEYKDAKKNLEEALEELKETRRQLNSYKSKAEKKYVVKL